MVCPLKVKNTMSKKVNSPLTLKENFIPEENDECVHVEVGFALGTRLIISPNQGQHSQTLITRCILEAVFPNTCYKMHIRDSIPKHLKYIYGYIRRGNIPKHLIQVDT